MPRRPRTTRTLLSAAFGIAISLSLFSAAFAVEKRPIIIIPGLTGSELINDKTGEVVWFKAPRSKEDDLRLPITANPIKSRDSLVPGDILRSIKFGIFPRIDVYGGLIEAFEKRGGYHEEKWNEPTAQGDDAALYVYPYDWRLDNVENARLLIRRIDQLKAKLKKPELKFDIIAHSMGGLISRYAAMYGDADLPLGNRKPVPNWAGSKDINKIVLLGTPSEGSALALNSLVNGFAIGGININLPFVQNLSRFDLFTIPSAYQLLPAPGTFRAMDENFEPVSIDLYDAKQWSKYGWNAIDDDGFPQQFKTAERRLAPAYLAANLDRARRFHEALAAVGHNGSGVSINIVGSDCRESLDSIVMFRDAKTDKLRTIFKPVSFARNGGAKVTVDELRKLMLGPGDGIVTRRSLDTDTLSRFAGIESILRPASSKFICEEHNKLAANTEIQDYLIGLLAVK